MIPYVIGQWVRGDHFYGRRAALAEILDGPRPRQWWAGLRRIGKTSLLREVDRLAGNDPHRRLLPVSWDLQGVGSRGELAASFAEALLDAEDRLLDQGVNPPGGAEADAVAALVGLAEEAFRVGSRLLLLIDEADALLDLAGTDPALPEALWAAFETAQARVVLASSVRLADVGRSGGSRPVPGLERSFGAPRLLGMLEAAAAVELLRQSQLPESRRPVLTDADLERLRRQAGHHPMLLQILGKRSLELGTVELALEQVAVDLSVGHLFAVDFDLLLPAERDLLLRIARGDAPGDEPPAIRLQALGLLTAEAGRLSIGYPLLARWLRQQA